MNGAMRRLCFRAGLKAGPVTKEDIFLIEPRDRYSLATRDFLAKGGSVYGLAFEKTAFSSGRLVREFLTEYLLKHVLEQKPHAASF